MPNFEALEPNAFKNKWFELLGLPEDYSVPEPLMRHLVILISSSFFDMSRQEQVTYFKGKIQILTRNANHREIVNIFLRKLEDPGYQILEQSRPSAAIPQTQSQSPGLAAIYFNFLAKLLNKIIFWFQSSSSPNPRAAMVQHLSDRPQSIRPIVAGFKLKLEQLMQRSVSEEFSRGLERHLPADFFSRGERGRLFVLLEKRQDTDFIRLLSNNRTLSKSFLLKSVNDDLSLVQLMCFSRLGPFIAEDSLLFLVQQRGQTPREVKPSIGLPTPAVHATLEIGRQINDNDCEWLVDFRCPIGLSLIVGEAVKLKHSNGKYVYYDKSALMTSISQNPVNPLTREPINIRDIEEAPEYRGMVIEKIREHLGDSEQAQIKIETILKNLKWTDTPDPVSSLCPSFSP